MHNTLWDLATVELHTASMTKNMYGSLADTYHLGKQSFSANLAPSLLAYLSQFLDQVVVLHQHRPCITKQAR